MDSAKNRGDVDRPSSSELSVFLDSNAELNQDSFSVCDLQPSPENDQLYKPVDSDDPEILELANSIAENGLLEPLVVTEDRFILSGHRRFAACQLAGLKEIDCRVVPFCRRDDSERYVTLLREHNRQREKTLAEQLREEIVSSDPDKAYSQLRKHRFEVSKLDVKGITIRRRKPRSKISEAKRPMIDAVLRILKDLSAFLPVTVRSIHYQLLNAPPLVHASKANSTYRNQPRDYKNLVNLLVRARIEGLVPMEAICDETRPITTWNIFPNPQPFIREQLDDFLTGYYRDLMQSQPYHIEVVCEKNTVHKTLHQVLYDYTIPLTTGRGFSSLPPRRDMAERFLKSGKDRLVVLMVSDFDPSGEEIAHSFAASMVEDFNVASITAIKVALTKEQVQERKLEHFVKPKPNAGGYKRFVARYGKKAWELEALKPTDLQQIVRNTIDSIIDTEVFKREVDLEREDASRLETINQQVQEKLTEVDFGG
ncbi:MAG: ParB N-terminal domain-containing protein [Planctomycetes bacterium]|nr:ParB N-terminal domain-containing protein [Planctomycetota bacterium]